MSECKCCGEISEKEKCKKNIDLPQVALVGNPNVGKSVIFNALSNIYVEVSNFPGTTVDVSRTFIEEGEIIDTPGVYGISNYTDDELVTQKVIQTADVVVNVVSALSLERDLFLTQQLVDLEFPMILVVNQVDEANARGIKIDFEKLESTLGIKAIPTVAIHNTGINEIKKSIKNKEFKIPLNKIPYIKELAQNKQIKRCERNIELIAIESKSSHNPDAKDVIYSQRRELVTSIVDCCVSQSVKNASFSVFLGNILLNPVIGIITAFAMLYMLYQLIGVFLAGDVVDFLNTYISENYTPWIRGLVENNINLGFVNEILTGEFGMLTMTVELIFGVILPLVGGFYLFMALLEDSGYLPRLAVLVDSLLSKLGMNGRAIIPIILGFGCGGLGVITTRILGSNKERIIATALIGLTVPCSAQMGIIIALVAAAGGFKAWLLYILSICTVFVLAGTALNKLLKGKPSDLLIDIPPMRLPVITNTLNKTFFRITNFLKEAIPMFLIGSFAVSVLKIIGVLELLQKALGPIVKGLLNLPEQFADVFVMGLIRRDFGSVGILEMAGVNGSTGILDSVQIVVATVVVTLFVPCFAALVIIYKERGPKEASIIWLGSLVVAILTGAILTKILPFVI